MRSSSNDCSQGSSNRSSSGGATNSIGGKSSAGIAAAVALHMPSSAAGASALGVRQLKALLAALGVDCSAAVEKSDLVGALVAHLGLS
jgi:hypothetical protein